MPSSSSARRSSSQAASVSVAVLAAVVGGAIVFGAMRPGRGGEEATTLDAQLADWVDTQGLSAKTAATLKRALALNNIDDMAILHRFNDDILNDDLHITSALDRAVILEGIAKLAETKSAPTVTNPQEAAAEAAPQAVEQPAELNAVAQGVLTDNPEFSPVVPSSSTTSVVYEVALCTLKVLMLLKSTCAAVSITYIMLFLGNSEVGAVGGMLLGILGILMGIVFMYYISVMCYNFIAYMFNACSYMFTKTTSSDTGSLTFWQVVLAAAIGCAFMTFCRICFSAAMLGWVFSGMRRY